MSRAQNIKAAIKALPKTASKGIEEFTQEFFARVPEEDLKSLTPAIMARMACDHFEMMNKRPAGEPIIRSYSQPVGALDGEGSMDNTIINIVNDDMPFLVDSVAAEIARHHRVIIHLVHPILYAQHNNNGKVKSVNASSQFGGSAESHMYIEIIGGLSEDKLKELEANLYNVLRDVRFATGDWPKLKAMLVKAKEGLAHAPASINSVDLEEYKAFLDYVSADNFTLLGCRETEIDAQGAFKNIASSSLGILNNKIKPALLTSKEIFPVEDAAARKKLPALLITKINKAATVHRRVPMDSFIVKKFDQKGKFIGEFIFVGLFTSVTYSRSIADVPLLRHKAEAVTTLSKFKPGSHNYKALRHILEKYPRDEIFQLDTEDLLQKSLSILQLQERQRIALYTRTDVFNRYISCLVYIPRDRYDSDIRADFQKLLETNLGGVCQNFYTTLDDSPLARVMYMIYLDGEKKPKFDEAAIENELQEMGRLWSEKLGYALLKNYGDDDTQIKYFISKYGDAFPSEYESKYLPKQAIHDLDKLEEVAETGKFALDIYRDNKCTDKQLRLKIYNSKASVPLSDILPMVENMGLKVLSELSFEITPEKAEPLFIQDFLMDTEIDVLSKAIPAFKANFEESLLKTWYGEVENDGLNRLIISCHMNWREVMILRTCVRYLRQSKMQYSITYIERALTNNKDIARLLVDLFYAYFDPKNGTKGEDKAQKILKQINDALAKVASLDEDKILRSVTNLIQQILRTNFFQKDANGEYKTYLSIKIDSANVPELPLPRPYREIYVYAPWAEAIHLRMDRISRGGIRWSDRHEDFRTEVLGLVKAQNTKNAIIIPMGAKGGFIVKNPPDMSDRKAYMDEGIRCYRTLIRGMLDITDNSKGKKIIPPVDVVRRDDNDPYIVAAADKGTATFSNFANALSAEYGFWLDDAFASGGSQGYDHKKMGITARGAWESVKRHFREMGLDTQTQEFDVIGVGDMGGDVFGNGMLLSEHIRLIGAFNHLHIFCDPNPDVAKTFKERQRLFDGVMGWDQYDQKLLSKGGRIYSRKEKSLELTPEIMECFGIDKKNVSPLELMNIMLKAETDLLWFGGIGTYIKSEKENNSEVGDKANDAIRINGSEVRAKVIGEGANLGTTQLSRIEYAMNGGAINTDFIDNSGGVDSSDHEVNIKILMRLIMDDESNKMTLAARNKLLEAMTPDIVTHVLRNNYQQSQGISLMTKQATDNVADHAHFISYLEEHQGLNRAVEFLPTPAELEQRRLAGKGLTRPELSVIQSYAKINIATNLLATNLPDKKDMEEWLINYFPERLRSKYAKEIQNHRLRREIIATMISSNIVNRMGPTFVTNVMEKTGAPIEDVIRAYMLVRDSFDLANLWARIEKLDGKVNGQVQLQAMIDISYMVEHEVLWSLTKLGRSVDLAKDVPSFQKGIAALRQDIGKTMRPDQAEVIKARYEQNIADGMPKDLANDIAMVPALGTACDIARAADDLKMPIVQVAKAYNELGAIFALDWLREAADKMQMSDRWSNEALESITEQLHNVQVSLTIRVMNDMRATLKGKTANQNIVESWMETHEDIAEKIMPMIEEMKAGTVELPMLIIAEQRLRAIAA